MVTMHSFAFVMLIAAAPADDAPVFRDVIRRVVLMPNDVDLQKRAWYRHKLNVLNVMWEDTGRDYGSSVGPNISDLTLQVHEKTKRGTRTHLLPVIRHPNFTDKTGDVAANKIWVKVGNQGAKDGETKAVPLTHVLQNLKEYLSDPDSLKGSGDFLAKRDTHFLVSAQHVFVPLPEEGKVEFNPVLFNYQSGPGSPAVLVILATRQGTSVTVIDNRDSDVSSIGWGQQLFFNHGGDRTLFTAERRSAVERRIESGNAEVQDKGALDEGSDMMMLIQVPLKQRVRPRSYFGLGLVGSGAGGGGIAVQGAPSVPKDDGDFGGRSRRESDVERAVIGHGEAKGKFPEGRNYKVERDPRFPVRVTVQFYKATSNGVVNDTDLADAAAAIARVYRDADYVGSLVVPERDRKRPTDWDHGDDPGLAPVAGWHPPLLQ